MPAGRHARSAGPPPPCCAGRRQLPARSPDGSGVLRTIPYPSATPPAASVPRSAFRLEIPMIRRLSAWQPWLSTAARLFLAYLFISAGWPKLIDSVGTVRSVRGFQLLPEALVPAFGYALPMV